MHIPNAFPDKQKLIEQLSDKKKNAMTKELLQDLTLKNQSKMQLTVIKQDDKKSKITAVREFDDEEKIVNPKEKKEKKQPIKEHQKIIEMSDIIIEVLDARDPISFRCEEAEKLVMNAKTDKKLIFVLSKIDLVPLPVVLAWKRELEKEHPVVLFKAALQKQTAYIGHAKLQSSFDKSTEHLEEMLKSSKSLGAQKLFDLINSFSKGDKDKKVIGVIGYPNSGKIAVMNCLKRQRKDGVTSASNSKKAPVEFEIDAKLKIVDTPGIINSAEDEAILVLRNQSDAVDVKDPITPITAILEKINNRTQMMQLYKIAHYDDPQSFLYNVAVAKGKFKKVSYA
jgi:nuclear GTP-binding protein